MKKLINYPYFKVNILYSFKLDTYIIHSYAIYYNNLLKIAIGHISNEKPTAPRFIEKLQPKHVPDGGAVQFECHVEGNPRPQITWFRQTAIIKPSHDFQVCQ